MDTVLKPKHMAQAMAQPMIKATVQVTKGMKEEKRLPMAMWRRSQAMEGTVSLVTVAARATARATGRRNTPGRATAPTTEDMVNKTVKGMVDMMSHTVDMEKTRNMVTRRK